MPILIGMSQLSDHLEVLLLKDPRGELRDVRLIGKGGMSLVYRAWQPSLERHIVLKRLRDDLIQDAETIERFRREAKALAAVLHQNIAHVYDFVENSTEAFILMEYIEGVDLSSVVEKTEGIPAVIAACILLELCKGLAYIHERKLVHRDIKPSNIRLTPRGGVKLMDFGIVLQLKNTALTRPGIMVGSPSYLSPEQIIGDPVTHRADMFLLGIVFYEMLTGVKPFKDAGAESIYQRIRESRYVQLRKMEPSVPRPLEKIVSKCLKKNPQERYRRMEDLILELKDFLGATASANPEKYIRQFLEAKGILQSDVPPELFPTGEWRRKPSFFRSPLFLIGAITAVAFAFGFLVSLLFFSPHASTNLGISVPSNPQPISR